MGLNLIRGKGKPRQRGLPQDRAAVVFPTRYCIKTMMIFNDKPHTLHLTPHPTPHTPHPTPEVKVKNLPL
ncbi:hypothetical protein BJP36_08785 [Moorena producens JHB]|uniref:Uncharacterized protein n=1 Tax=Moorena producens (strain JHB) TaxID=1454205 RepID=A0A1D9FX90_MOOP1|nr:hypothetical protein [Moorena producens]AOY80008.1 hypothetical protein BJP36_08785 [Moorena producens JHB]